MTFWLCVSVRDIENEIEEQDFRSVHGEIVQVVIHRRHWMKLSFTSCLFQLQPIFPWYYGAILNSLCNRERAFSFTLIIDHQRYYESHFKERFQVYGTISGFHTWSWPGNFDIDKHWRYWSHAIHSCWWLGWDCERTSHPCRQCGCSASPFAFLGIDLLLSSRSPIIWESLPQFPL